VLAAEKDPVSKRFFENPISRSLGLHLLLLLLFFVFVTQFAHEFAPTTAPIEVTFLDKAKQDLAPKQKTEDDRTKTVVQRSEGKQVDVAKKDSYLSEKTKVVDEEVSARNSGEIHVIPGQPRPMAKPAQKAVPKNITVADLGVKIVPKVEKQYTEDHTWADQQTGEAVLGGQYVKGLKEGEVSALNTKEFIFFSYFDRVRRQLDQAWQPILRENIAHIFKVGRRIASNSEYVTRTIVTLNAKGEIVKVQILEESGTHDIDQAAVDALNKAGPYPNPPKGLIDASGLVSIRWDFILKT
jgi:TonB family protein